MMSRKIAPFVVVGSGLIFIADVNYPICLSVTSFSFSFLRFLMDVVNANEVTQSIEVLLVDDHPAVREALATAINARPDVRVCGEAENAQEALDMVGKHQPDVAVVDISLEKSHGLDLVQNLCSLYPDVQVIVFSMHDESVYAERAIRAGAVGYLMKSEPTHSVMEAIMAASRGEVYLSKAMAARILSRVVRGRTESRDRLGTTLDELTDRELEVFEGLGQGRTVPQIMEQLCLSRKTVETYRRRAKEKLGFDTVAELLRFAVQWTYGRDTPEGPGKQRR